MKSLLSLRPSKQKKITDYMSILEEVISFFLIAKPYFEKNLKDVFQKPQKFLGTHGTSLEDFCDKSVKV